MDLALARTGASMEHLIGIEASWLVIASSRGRHVVPMPETFIEEVATVRAVWRCPC